MLPLSRKGPPGSQISRSRAAQSRAPTPYLRYRWAQPALLIVVGFHTRPVLILPAGPLPLRRLLLCSSILLAFPILTEVLQPHPFGGGLALAAADLLLLLLDLLLLFLTPAARLAAARQAPSPQVGMELLLGGEKPAETQHPYEHSPGGRGRGGSACLEVGGGAAGAGHVPGGPEGPSTHRGGYGRSGHAARGGYGGSGHALGGLWRVRTRTGGDAGAGHVAGGRAGPGIYRGGSTEGPGTYRGGGGALWRDWARSGGDGVAGHVPGVIEGRVGLGPALTGRGPALPLQPRPPCCRTRR